MGRIRSDLISNGPGAQKTALLFCSKRYINLRFYPSTRQAHLRLFLLSPSRIPLGMSDAGYCALLSPYSALGMSLDLADSRWAIWAICGSARETAAGVCNKIQLLPQPHAMGPVLGQRAKHAKCSLFNPASTKLFALSHHFPPPGPGIEPGTFGSKVRLLARLGWVTQHASNFKT